MSTECTLKAEKHFVCAFTFWKIIIYRCLKSERRESLSILLTRSSLSPVLRLCPSLSRSIWEWRDKGRECVLRVREHSSKEKLNDEMDYETVSTVTVCVGLWIWMAKEPHTAPAKVEGEIKYNLWFSFSTNVLLFGYFHIIHFAVFFGSDCCCCCRLGFALFHWNNFFGYLFCTGCGVLDVVDERERVCHFWI